MSNMSYEDRHYHRRERFEQGYRELAAQGVFRNQPLRPAIPAELWVCVAFALIADSVSRAFGWLRTFAYWAFLLAIANSAYGAVGFEGHHWAFDLICAAYLFRSFGRLFKREWTY